MVVSIFGLILIAIIYGLKGEWEGDRRDSGSADLISVPKLTKKCPKTLEFRVKNLGEYPLTSSVGVKWGLKGYQHGNNDKILTEVISPIARRNFKRFGDTGGFRDTFS